MVLFTKSRFFWGGFLFSPFFFFLFFINSCSSGVSSHPQGSYLLTKGQAIREIKLKYSDLVQFHECSKSPSQICSEKDIFVLDDVLGRDYDIVFRDGSGRIYNINLEDEVFYFSEYYYFTVTKTTGDVLKKGVFEKKVNSKSKLDGSYDFTCKGKYFWSVPVTTDCSEFTK